ncbi:MAG: hypothetical protein ACTS1Z_05495, partial [Parasphingopyxis sp.]|uniref:hypothetical protein n=1 Tax=Parasphingopyxis sp. TaxID=1920299 RepID=UPI003FA1857B
VQQVPQPVLPPQRTPPMVPPQPPAQQVPPTPVQQVPQPVLPPQRTPPMVPPQPPAQQVPPTPVQQVPQPVLPPQRTPGPATVIVRPDMRPPIPVQTGPVAITRPRPVTVQTVTVPMRGPDTLVRPVTDIPPRRGFVAVEPGRHDPHALPSFEDDRGTHQCLASGFGRRHVPGDGDETRAAGVVPILRTPDMVMRDIPALRHRGAECVILIRRRHTGE